MVPTYNHVVFVARSSISRTGLHIYRRESDEDLRLSLEYTKACYEHAYGRIQGICEFHTFGWPSFLELPEDGETVRFFALRTAGLASTNGQMMVVLNGWDGLTSHAGSFSRLFKEYSAQVTLRVFADNPRSFYQVNVAQIFQLFEGTILINPYLEGLPHEEFDEGTLEVLNQMESQLEYSTALFYRYFRAFGDLQIN